MLAADKRPPVGAARRKTSYGEVGLSRRLRDALARLNPALPAEALEDAFRKLTRPDLPAASRDAAQAGGSKPQLQEPIEDPARFDWHEVTKVAHYYLSVDAMTKPDLPAGRQVQVREESPPYGGGGNDE